MDNPQGKTAFYQWFAGLVDGEGWIGLRHTRRNGKTYPQPCFKISMTHHYPTLDYIREQIGDDFPFHVEDYERKNQKPFWVLSVIGFRRIIKALPTFMNYLVTKREPAEHLYMLCCKRVNREGYRRPYSEDELEHCEALTEQR